MMLNNESPTDKNNQTQQTRFDALKLPVILLEANGNTTITANEKACELFDKQLIDLVGHKAGRVFDCYHSFTENQCEKEPTCQTCKIRIAIQETFETGKPIKNLHEVIDRKLEGKMNPYHLYVSTQKVDDFIMLTIDKYEKKA